MILNTEQNGAAKIQEDTENLKQEFEKLMTDVQDIRQKLTSRAAQLEEIQKVYISSTVLCVMPIFRIMNCIFIIMFFWSTIVTEFSYLYDRILALYFNDD